VQYDNVGTRYLERCGYGVLRFWNNEIFENIEGVAEVILDTLVQRAETSPPNPPLEREG
jgi:very-short-patch-repair endonuclease